jgi:hypothetical protein
MGHRRFGARVTEVEQFGQKFLRAEVLGGESGIIAEQLVHPQSIYAVTKCSESQARMLNTPWRIQDAVPTLALDAEASRPVRATVQDADVEDEHDDDLPM